jgi:hypothetical protein
MDRLRQAEGQQAVRAHKRDRCTDDWRDAFRKAGLTSIIPQAQRIIACESGGDRRAVSYTGDYGLFQINWAAHQDKVYRRGWQQRELFDPYKNAQIAVEIYLALGRWGSTAGWVCAAKVGLY